ncbi:tetratricopeptide repeat protein [Novosphingobium sp. FSY-8]|uniref:Tetratricopeptide repeat protein n=1 Tax=Novosphingobium ovatum TaxID=1908523 RepID=A0ABW9X938_9SPHN|nr:tetratricopeptide repeat protein [Novosphingobium ovatum]NBC35034.1 tetratricopeptide repeat protein [Novosphingobium ovatum]
MAGMIAAGLMLAAPMANAQSPAPAPAPSPAAVDPLETTLTDAIGLLRQRRPADAYAALEPSRKEVAARITAARAKGGVYCATSSTESLFYLMGAAATKTPAIVMTAAACQTLYLSAFLQTEMGHGNEAQALLQQLVELAPRNPQYLGELAYTQQRLGQMDAAMASYERARDAAPMAGSPEGEKRARARALRGIGYILVERGKLDEAEAAYRAALKDDPDSQVAREELTYIAQQRQRK